jgi:hypothetical protein
MNTSKNRCPAYTGPGTGPYETAHGASSRPGLRKASAAAFADASYEPAGSGPSTSPSSRLPTPSIVVPLLRRKYGWQRRALEIQGRLSSLLRRRPPAASVYLELNC